MAWRRNKLTSSRNYTGPDSPVTVNTEALALAHAMLSPAPSAIVNNIKSFTRVLRSAPTSDLHPSPLTASSLLWRRPCVETCSTVSGVPLEEEAPELWRQIKTGEDGGQTTPVCSGTICLRTHIHTGVTSMSHTFFYPLSPVSIRRRRFVGSSMHQLEGLCHILPGQGCFCYLATRHGTRNLPLLWKWRMSSAQGCIEESRPHVKGT